MLMQMRLQIIIGGLLFLIVGIFINSIWNIIQPGTFNESLASGVMKIMLFVNIMFEINIRNSKKALNAE